jgi:hypothetical protein
MEDWTLVFDGPRLKAEIVMSALQAAGFNVAGLGGMEIYAGLDFDDGRLYVPAEEAEEAKRLIERAEADADLD